MNLLTAPLLLLSIVLSFSCSLSEPKHFDTVHYSKQTTESHFKTTGTIAFHKKNAQVIATIKPSGNQPSVALVWPNSVKNYQSINTSKLYPLEFLQAQNNGIKEAPAILRIYDGDIVLFDNSICSLHRIPMMRQLEDTRDKDGYDENFFQTYRPQHCPNDGKAYLACGSGILHLNWKCQKCYNLSEKWRINHRIKE